MSKEGIRLFASVLNTAQHVRGEIFTQSTTKGRIDKVDIRLAHLLDIMKDSIKDEFCKLTTGGFK